MKKISIVIIDYNSYLYTLECLKSLDRANFKGMSIQVIVVDNGSRERLIIQSKFENFKLELLHSEKNTGFTGGNNIGIQYALQEFIPDYFLLLNNDTVVDNNFLEELLQYAESEKNVGAICPMIYFEKGFEFHKQSYAKEELGQVIWFAGGSIDWKNMYAFHRGVDQVDRGQFDWTIWDDRREKLNTSLPHKNLTVPYISTKKMDFATGCCMLIPREVIERVGMFDDSYFLYWEDVDLSERIKRAGYTLLFYPKAKIYHKNAGSSGGSGSTLQKKYQQRNRLRFALRYAPLKTKILVFVDYLHSIFRK